MLLTAGRQPRPYLPGVQQPCSYVSTSFQGHGFSHKSVSPRPNPFSLCHLKARNGACCTAPHQAWLAAGAAHANICSALSHTHNLISALPQAMARLALRGDVSVPASLVSSAAIARCSLSSRASTGRSSLALGSNARNTQPSSDFWLKSCHFHRSLQEGEGIGFA